MTAMEAAHVLLGLELGRGLGLVVVPVLVLVPLLTLVPVVVLSNSFFSFNKLI
jgi:hypothetical protein